MTDHPLVERCRAPTDVCRAGVRRRRARKRNETDMATPEQSAQSEICNPKSEIGAEQPFSSGQYGVSPNEPTANWLNNQSQILNCQFSIARNKPLRSSPLFPPFSHVVFLPFASFPLSGLVLVSGFGLRISDPNLAVSDQISVAQLAATSGYERLRAVMNTDERFEHFCAFRRSCCTQLQYF